MNENDPNSLIGPKNQKINLDRPFKLFKLIFNLNNYGEIKQNLIIG